MSQAEKMIEAVEEVGKLGLVSEAPEKLGLKDATLAYLSIGHLENLLKARKEALRNYLMQQAESHGKPSGDKGALAISVSGCKVVRERKTASTPDAERVKIMVKEQGLPVTEAFDEVTVLELNPSKVQYLIDTGKLDPAEVEATKKVSFGIRVTASSEVKSLLETAAPVPESK